MRGKKAKALKKFIEKAVNKNEQQLLQTFIDKWLSTPEAMGWYHSRVYVQILGILFVTSIVSSIALLWALYYYKILFEIKFLLIIIAALWVMVILWVSYIAKVSLKPISLKVHKPNNNTKKKEQ